LCIAAVYWITSSAVASNVSGMVRPRALAVLRLTTEPLAKLQWCDEFSTGMSGKRGVRGVLG
jgi:hypothetical protein